MGSTLLSLGNVFPARSQQFEKLVIDEGGQCHPAYAVSGLLRAQKALVIGDVHQLEPVVQLSVEDEARVRKASRVGLSIDELQPFRVGVDQPNSAQSLADACMDERPSLDAHFRCHPEIIGISDALCDYGLDIRTPEMSRLPIPSLSKRVHLLNVTGHQERVRGSWWNRFEVEACVQTLDALHAHGVPWTDMALITPYVGQLDALRKAVRQASIPYQGAFELDDFRQIEDGIALGTVHRFQGGERRFVLFSTVVTQTRSLNFLNRRVNLVNVAISRAREQFFIIGHEGTLRGGEFTRILVDHSVVTPWTGE